MDAFAVTIKLAVLTSLILLVLGLPLAYFISVTRWRFRFLLEAAVALPLVLPPTVVGFYLLMLLGPNCLVGRIAADIFGEQLPFTFKGILLGAVIFNTPFAVRPFISAFASVDRKLVEQSWCLGVSKFQTFFRIIIPMAWPGILTGIVLAFSHTLGEFGVVLMLGGNISGVTRTISTSIYDDVQSMAYASANQTALILVGFAFVTLCCVYALQKRNLPL